MQSINATIVSFRVVKIWSKRLLFFKDIIVLTILLGEEDMKVLTSYLSDQNLSGFPLVVISDNSQFTSKNMDNFVWVTFTRSNPSHDIYGVGSFVSHKHWGCKGSLIIDARKKPHHAPELVADTAIQKKVAEWLNF